MTSLEITNNADNKNASCLINRRQFLLNSSTAAIASFVPVVIYNQVGEAQSLTAKMVKYPNRQLTKLSELKVNEPININYPDDGNNTAAILVKLGVPAGGGIGPDEDIVAFSYYCSHQGGPLQGTYKAVDEHRVLGPCPFHLSLFDLTRHGILVSGQAYQSLPQIVLEMQNDNVVATGIMGLLFGRTDNLIATARG
ncbi:arsenate reductase (azurin) small subunit [Endozoicomonas sp. SM1973]|uniref:Arsenate reductase (Azurin) small subunit n=1 Tax=Spartinivicinus marinus TaxID=2994442 RepID=A0A853I6S3_9GAMM|nr:arsenate reductase (azurin) small subunit [Spartinivicinus marinus]MCX4027460.1 arsenate reductase (azurin) small subunit [Spartinivicinus marinus]NYZ66368.1 arsenate reductase (azurin) small subunit [Spartinivicinus marinus]